MDQTDPEHEKRISRMGADAWLIMHQINQYILQTTQAEALHELLNKILATFYSIFPYLKADVLIYPPDSSDAIRVVSMTGPVPGPENDQRYRRLKKLKVMENTLIVLQHGIKDDPYLPDDYLGELLALRSNDYFCAHFVRSKNIYGSFIVVCSERISDEQSNQLAVLADFIATTITAKDIWMRMRNRTEELETLVSISSALRKVRQKDEMYTILIHEITKALGADIGIILMLEDNGLRVSGCADFMDIVGNICEGKLYSIGEGAVWEVLNENSPVFYTIGIHENPGNVFPEWIHFPKEIKSLALVPMATSDQVVGLIYVGRRRLQPFTEIQKRVLNAVAELGGNAFYRVAMKERLEQYVTDRTRALATLYSIAAKANTMASYQENLNNALIETTQSFHCPQGFIHLITEDQRMFNLIVDYGWQATPPISEEDQLIVGQFLQWINNRKTILWIVDLEQDVRTRKSQLIRFSHAYIGIPIYIHGNLAGVLSLFGKIIRNFSQDDFSLLSAIADQIGIILESNRLRQLAEEKAVIEERQRLARDLHDSVTQTLYSLIFLSETWRRAIQNNRLESVAEWPDDMDKISYQALKEMRLLLFELRPIDLEQTSLVEAIQMRLSSVEKRTNVDVLFSVKGEDHLPRSVAYELYQAACEALNNVQKHAGSTRVSIELFFSPESFLMEISDDGIGFDPNEIKKKGGMGLRGIRERVEKIGGKLIIDSTVNHGTKITIRLGNNSGLENPVE